jgi:putative addiction module component (TIGR02574 family)
MASNLPQPPPGFDELPVEDQIDYVLSLWDHIAAKPDQVPVPGWHRGVIRQRIANLEAGPSAGQPWKKVRDRVRKKLKGRSSQA